jgi:AcrR family transcriptional regulator
MDDIAHNLGISKKTLYQHYADKDDIVTTALKNYVNSRCTEFASIKAKINNPIEELVLMSERLKQSIKNANPSMLFDLQKYHHVAWDLWKTYRNEYIRESLVRNLREGIELGFYREDLNPDIIATVRLELIDLGFDQQVFPKDQFTTTEVQMQLLEHFTQGILTTKGRKLYEKYRADLSLGIKE